MMPQNPPVDDRADLAEAVLRFWFEEIEQAQWWRVDPAFDALLRTRYGALLLAAVRGELWAWRRTPRGRLAEVIVLDQFSRNIHRGTSAAFAADAQALVLAQEAVAAGADALLEPAHRRFLYMPYMHSESVAVHEQAVGLFTALAMPEVLDYELRHQAIILRFGRYPHRNAILGRESSAEELEFLQQPGSSF